MILISVSDNMPSGLILVNNSCISDFVTFEFTLIKGRDLQSGSKMRRNI